MHSFPSSELLFLSRPFNIPLLNLSSGNISYKTTAKGWSKNQTCDGRIDSGFTSLLLVKDPLEIDGPFSNIVPRDAILQLPITL